MCFKFGLKNSPIPAQRSNGVLRAGAFVDWLPLAFQDILPASSSMTSRLKRDPIKNLFLQLSISHAKSFDIIPTWRFARWRRDMIRLY
jgi:hypothetical protein